MGEVKSLPISPGLIPVLWKKAKKSDLVVVHYPFPLADAAIALVRFRLPPVIIYWHSEIISQRYARWLIKPMTNLMLTRCKAIVVSSPRLVEHSILLKKYKDKCHVIPFGYEPPRGNEISDHGYFLCIGRHVPYKGIEVLIRSLQHCDAHIHVIGIGPLLKFHRELADELGVGNRVEFITDADDRDVQLQVSRCKALVLPSIMPSEAFALVQLEAMSIGKPVINTYLPSGVPWVARNFKEGLTVDPGNEQSLAWAMSKLLKDDELLKKLGNSAKLRWEKKFTMKKFSDETAKLYSEILR
jgi:rhamnosyl/mannosyltransferase